MNKTAVTTVICVLLLGLGALVVAQDIDPVTIYDGYFGDVITYPDPDPMEVEGMVVPEGSLETVTGDSAPWYGQVVTLEGEIGDFISTRMFTLGEGAALDNDQVLVVNNSTYTFPPEVMEHARIRVTGRILPSLEAVNQGTPSDFGDLFGRDTNAVDTMPTDNTMDMSQTDFTMLESSLSTYGFVVTEDHVGNIQTLDANLENLTDDQRIQLADALEQDAAVNEATYPNLSRNLRDAAIALRNNDIATARAALQSGVQMVQPTTDAGTTSDDMDMTAADFTSLDSALTNYGFVITEDHVANLQQLDTNLETLSAEQQTALANALEQDAAANDVAHPAMSQSLRDAAAALRNGDAAGARFALQIAVEDINNQSMMMPTIDPTAVGDQSAAPTAMPGMVDPTMTTIDFSRPNMVEWAYQGLIPINLNNFTILEVFSVDNVDFVEFAPDVVNGNG